MRRQLSCSQRRGAGRCGSARGRAPAAPAPGGPARRLCSYRMGILQVASKFRWRVVMNRGGTVRSHKLKLMVPAALVLAGLFVLTLGIAAAQAAPLIRGRGAHYRALTTSHGGVTLGFALVSAAIVAIVAAVIYYAVVADRRPVTSTVVAGEPAAPRRGREQGQAGAQGRLTLPPQRRAGTLAERRPARTTMAPRSCRPRVRSRTRCDHPAWRPRRGARAVSVASARGRPYACVRRLLGPHRFR